MRFVFFFIAMFCVVNVVFANDNCAPRPVLIKGNSLEPMVKDQSRIPMLPAICVEIVNRGDLIIFKTGAHKKQVIKRVQAIEGDKFFLSGGRIFVNDSVLKNSAGHDYILSRQKADMLALYQNHYDGVIPENTFLVLGDSVHGGLDSSQIGLIHRNDILMVSQAY